MPAQMTATASVQHARRWIIAGGGPGGLTLAILLQRLGREVVVLERQASPDVPTRDGHIGLGIWVNALRCLRKAGVSLDALEQQGSYMRDSGYMSVDGKVLAKPGTMLQDGHLLFVRKDELITQLRATLQGDNVVRYGSRVTAVEDRDGSEAVRVHVGSSKEEAEAGRPATAGATEQLKHGMEEEVIMEGDVLVVADGLFTSLRAMVPGMARIQPAYRGYSVYRGVVPRVVQAGFSFQTWGLGSRFASVPLRGGQVWFATVVRPPGLRHEEEEDLRPFLLQRFRGWHAPIEEMIGATPSEAVIYDDAYALPSFRGFSSRRVTAIGDAAHGVDPILAQGAGVAIEDAYELALQVASAASTSDAGLGEALARYEAATAPRAEILSALSNLSQALGQMTWQPAISARDAAFLACPALVKGRVFDAMIRLSLARAWSGAGGQAYGYEPKQIF